METKKPKTLLTLGGSLNWHEEFELHPRFPRGIPIDEIKKCMRNIEEPEIFLQELDEHIEIVIRLRKPSDILPTRIWKALKKDGVTLQRVFDALLWKKLDADRSNIWLELARPAVESYRQLWYEFFKMAYVGQFHPSVDVGLKQIESEIASEGKIKPRRGRALVPKSEIASIQKRYDELLPTCTMVHKTVESALSSLKVTKGGKNPNPAEIRRAVYQATRKSIHGLPFASHIFGDDAFKEYRCGLKYAHLHDPKSWTPHNLAISLLAFQRSQKWETVEKKLRRQKATVTASSLTRI
jgi:hypothetical protein